MSVEAGGVNIVLGLNAATYTEGIKQAQRELDKFAGKTKEAGHSTVSSMQASSAAIRGLENPLGNNLRAIERFITTIPGVGNALKAAFPLVGGIAFAGLLVDMGMKVAEFIKTVENMPKAITTAFATLNLSGQTSVDQLRVTNDLLQNSIDKLQGKPQNNAKLAFDEARLAADKLAESIMSADSKMNDLLSKNHLSGWTLLMGKRGTADREGTVKYYGAQQDDAALRIQQSVASGDKDAEAKARADLKSSQASELKNVLLDRASQIAGQKAGAGDGSANVAIDTGVATNILTQQNQQSEEERNAKLVPQKAAAEAAHAAALKATEARKKAAEEFGKMLEVDGEIAQKWKAYEDNNAKIFSEDNLEKYRTNFLSGHDSKSLSEAGNASSARITAMRQGIDLNKENSAAIAESSLQMAVATGQISKMDAARVMATMHQQQYADALEQLQDQAKAIATDPQYNNHDEARQAALIDNQSRQSALGVAGSIQAAQDNQNTNPASSSGLVGAGDALDEFVIASRDAASQMRELTDNTLKGFNQQVVGAMSGQGTQFGNFGAGMFRSVANTGLEKAEGSALSMFGFGGGGKLGTRSNPMFTKSADTLATAGGLLGKIRSPSTSSSGGFTGFLSGLLNSFIPHAASGGFINGPTLVGEDGPELFAGTGQITPNHKLVSSGSTGHTINIDATGSTDPAQTRVQVVRGIQAAAPHIAAATISSQTQDRRRTPPSQRK
jgi:lambda family phage tail tape measure protein